MGKSAAGASARAEFRRAGRAARCRGRFSRLAGVAGVAGGLVVAGRSWVAAAAIVIVGACASWMLRPDPDPDRWRRGAAGEVATARLLASLPARFVVLHDRRLPASTANIDHLVVGPTGVWVIDSKAVRAPLRVRRGVVWAGDHELVTASAAWEARRVAELLATERVEAVVAVHGDGLARRGKVVGGARVLPAGRLCRRVRRGGRRLTRSEIAAVAAAAERLLLPATRSPATFVGLLPRR